MERVDWTRIFVFVALVGGAYLGARLQGQIFAPWASLLLALGIGFQLTRIFVRRRDQILAIMHRSVLPLIGLIVVIAIGEVGITAFLEQRALARLPATESRPNILILVADTLRADHLSGYGYQRATTPRIDRFAAEGQLFLDAYSSSSWTLPSHASLLTGRRVHEHQAGREGHPDPTASLRHSLRSSAKPATCPVDSSPTRSGVDDRRGSIAASSTMRISTASSATRWPAPFLAA